MAEPVAKAALRGNFDTHHMRVVRSAMIRRLLTDRRAIPIVLVLQILPLVALPGASYSLKSQEWWLPAFLTVLVAAALFQVLVRRTPAAWPWYLIGFSQGFNIISRLMMLLPRVTVTVQGAEQFNGPAVLLFALTIIVSGLFVWYAELPEVRGGLLR